MSKTKTNGQAGELGLPMMRRCVKRRSKRRFLIWARALFVVTLAISQCIFTRPNAVAASPKHKSKWLHLGYGSTEVSLPNEWKYKKFVHWESEIYIFSFRNAVLVSIILQNQMPDTNLGNRPRRTIINGIPAKLFWNKERPVGVLCAPPCGVDQRIWVRRESGVGRNATITNFMLSLRCV